MLNHCFDDIEKFIIRLQHAYAAVRELQAHKKQARRSSAASGAPLQPPITGPELAMLNAQARGPNADDFFEILSKFKLAFNLLAKLKGCIHEPNAPELVHFLFTPLAIIIEAARNGKFRRQVSACNILLLARARQCEMYSNNERFHLTHAFAIASGKPSGMSPGMRAKWATWDTLRAWSNRAISTPPAAL